MTIRLASAFATHRGDVIAELQLDVTEKLVPEFNAEINDIGVEYDKLKETKGETFANNRKHARVMDLKVRQQQFINSLDKELSERMETRIKSYGGTVTPVKAINPKGEEKEVMEVKFPDGSVARVPQRLWINYQQFQRV
jgi:hypothetical protein